ncbi:MAG: NAD-dependent deacylase [Candidatus Helarchaeota archaeon]|nr:NAD-dependent deacylase [Candidatus Helarchaeota archaeon]
MVTEEEEIEKAAKLIIESKYAIVLTGAGISTESGIPDFRSPGTGLWTKVDPYEFGTATSFSQNPSNFFDLARELAPKLFSARPNKGHRALAKLEKRGYIKVIITQNIDDLHQRAHAKNVIEVHGNLREAYCTNCRKTVPIWKLVEDFFAGQIPTCECGGILRPNVVMFGEQPHHIPESFQYAEKCDLCIVVGSSLVVMPINMVPQIALNHGAKLLIINHGPAADTHLDSQATLVIREKAGVVLPKILDKVKELQEKKEKN